MYVDNLISRDDKYGAIIANMIMTGTDVLEEIRLDRRLVPLFRIDSGSQALRTGESRGTNDLKRSVVFETDFLPYAWPTYESCLQTS